MAQKKGSSKGKKPPQKRSHSRAQHGVKRKVPKGLLWRFILVSGVIFCGWLIYLDAQVRYKFEGKRWAMPAKVYARPLEIYNGRALNLDNLKLELALLNYQRSAKVSEPGQFNHMGQQVTLHTRTHLNSEGQHPGLLVNFRLVGDVVSNVMVADQAFDGIVSVDPFKIGGIYPGVKEERILIPFEAVPQGLVNALLATEDRDFYQHFGVSVSAIARAMWANFRAGRVVQGGSTLTQQLVKNFYLSSERSLTRKINEALMSFMLEAHYDKNAILGTYINDIYLGQSRGTAIHGFEMASRFYFGHGLERCDDSEFALLVAMVKGPSFYQPRRHPKRATARRNLVLDLMQEQGFVSQEVATSEKRKPLGVVAKPVVNTNKYPAFMDLVRRQLSEEYSEDDLRTEGLRIYTTLDPQIQARVEQSVARFMPQLKSRSKVDTLELGSVVTGVGTGEVLSVVGGTKLRFDGFNRALDAHRPIGSLIKPLVYLAALRQADKYHLLSPLQDTSFRLEFENGDAWEPSNFDKVAHGKVSLVDALTKSYNLSSARLGLDLGVERVVALMNALGVENVNPYPSLFLGAQTMSPMEVSRLYMSLASNGFTIPLRAIREVATAQGDALTRYPFSVKQVVEAEAIYLLQYAMQKVMRDGTGKSAYRYLNPALHVAGKTGTTNDFRDSWFAGFSNDYLGVVWLGDDNNASTSLSGSNGAMRIWSDYFATIPQYPLNMIRPNDVHVEWVDKRGNYLTDKECKGSEPVPFWGDDMEIPFRSCSNGFGSFGGWLKSLFE